jgi:hypothetical protein
MKRKGELSHFDQTHLEIKSNSICLAPQAHPPFCHYFASRPNKVWPIASSGCKHNRRSGDQCPHPAAAKKKIDRKGEIRPQFCCKQRAHVASLDIPCVWSRSLIQHRTNHKNNLCSEGALICLALPCVSRSDPEENDPARWAHIKRGTLVAA